MNVLVFAPHPDDEVIGCGGTIVKHTSMGDHVSVCIVTKGQPPVYTYEPEIAALPHDLIDEICCAHSVLGVKDTHFLGFPSVMLESVPRYQINGKISEMIQSVKPDVVYTPHYGDMQKDHSIVTESVMVAVRPKYSHCVNKVYAYETLSETEWNIPNRVFAFIPNVFNDISGQIEKKKNAMTCYKSQLDYFPNPRSLEAIEALARFRGSTMNAKAAEAFALIREYVK